MTPLMDQLHDIEGLDAVSAWPLAIGWWVLINCGILLLLVTLWFLKRRFDYLRSWKRDAFHKLQALEKNLSPETSRETVVLLSQYLRRIAFCSFPRKECAGLVGDAWLEWLQKHDPKQFDWSRKGKLLVESPYAPAESTLPLPEIKELIYAARQWVC
ncbi:DUF4381 domain-containing protein [Estrella lausannensis]|uniref:Conserved putative membrane protein n=1 Tax=Estrella lausannensis TaxID=483423 RepID=A0A0H5DNS7_9BACT|nr:DUF4381 domain-containing protein [Estrella lausannensis]CRX37947.1 Conserved putative membrane protein [Estrella lausannensis]